MKLGLFGISLLHLGVVVRGRGHGGHGHHGANFGGVGSSYVAKPQLREATAKKKSEEPPKPKMKTFKDTYRSVFDKMHITGVEPLGDSVGLPVFLWVMDAYSVFGSAVDFVWLEAMARRGFIAAAVDYVSLYDRLIWNLMIGGPQREFRDLDRKAESMRLAISQVCERPRADCTSGVAMAGHSQGGFITIFTPKYDRRITAVLAMGVGCLEDELAEALTAPQVSKYLSPSARLYITGAKDKKVGPECLDQMTHSLQADGSGYAVIPEGPHQFYGSCDPVVTSTELKCSYLHSQQPWGFAKVLDWLAMTASPAKANTTVSTTEIIDCTDQPIKFTPECTGEAQPLIFVVLIVIFVVLLPIGACIYCWFAPDDHEKTTRSYQEMPETNSVQVVEEISEEYSEEEESEE